MDDFNNDTQPVIETVERLSEPRIVTYTHVPVKGGDDLALMILPQGKKVEDLQPYLDKLRDAPKRIVTSAAMTSVDSFVEYLNRFKTPDSAIFLNTAIDKLFLLGIIDFHGQGAKAEPRFGKHRVSYAFPLSEQISVWKGASGRLFSNAEFATFLQDRQFDIANPPLDWMQVDKETLKQMTMLLNLVDDGGEIDDGAAESERGEDDDDRYIPRSALYKLRQIRFGSVARLVQMSRSIEVAVNAKAVEGYSPKTGERTVQFTEEHETRDKAGRKIMVPDMFLLRVPIFEGEQPQLVPVRLQYRRVGDGLKWAMTVVEWRRVVEAAVNAEAAKVKEKTALPLFEGMPGRPD